MNVRICALLFLFWAGCANAQGFANLGTDADGYAVPDPAYRFEFPKDHGPHPDFRIEWWYVTATLSGADGKDYGVQWTLFRSAIAADGPEDGWESRQIWMGHAGLTTPDQHFVAERFARGGIGQAGVVADPFEAWIDEWQLRGPDFDSLNMTAQGSDFAFSLDLSATGPLVPQGKNGYSVKSSAGQASHYYSQPFYTVTGRLDLPSGPVDVSGNAWLDREWSSQPLSESQTGWDWFSLSMNDGARLMGFRLRDNRAPAYTSATWIAPDGTPFPYDDGAFRAEPLDVVDVAGRSVPTRWRVTLADRDLDVTVDALNDQAWMATAFSYWEGPVRFDGTHQGRGYLEMTGYE
ncbi:MAG: lipocalin-like domain-containing protein [Pseudomonadota bacterium]